MRDTEALAYLALSLEIYFSSVSMTIQFMTKNKRKKEQKNLDK